MTPPVDDPLKLRILAVLQREGRLTNQDLAERVGATASPVWRRVKEMEENGLIRRYAALVEPEAVGIGLCAFAWIDFDMTNAEALVAFEEAVAGRPEIQECHAVAGDADFLLKIRTRDVAAYDQLLTGFLYRLPGVRRIRTSVAMRELKCDTALPIDDAAEE